MPKDALTIYRAAEELDFLVGGRVDKVTMPNADTLILLMHTAQGNHRLLLSCNPSLPRVHITTMQYKNPETASGTLMYFRKRLTGAVLTAITKERCERMISFEFSALDELRERVSYSLKAELTGKCANIIFVERDGIIGNALRKISAEIEGKRAVFNGLPYALPNPTGRVGVFDEIELKAVIMQTTGLSARAAANKCVAGLADATVNEIFLRLGINDDAQPKDEVIDKFIGAAQAMYTCQTEPAVTFDENTGKPLDYFISPYSVCGGKVVRYPALNAAMDAYYSALFAASDFTAYIKPLKAAVKNAVTKNKKRLAEANAKKAESERAEDDRMIGDLITANIYKIKRGDPSVTVDNFYDENGGQITISLDITKNAQQNAAAHYKAYTKKKKAAVYAEDAIKKATDALFELDAISTELELCTDKRELDEVRQELVSLGLIRPENKRLKQKPIPSEAYKFDVFGAELLVGKNHAQNDRITRSASRTDTWLHVKDAHGSHAVLKASSPTDEQLTRAAEIAAYYSQARGADHVPVDYTLIKFVYPHGGGRVEYKEYKTIFVTPKN
ncbi:MAG: fibronectin-binding domain-containing protein [Clostridiales bacterium]|nr:fibronectin-binding domain-containing protein [Clostridiales bacterium]